MGARDRLEHVSEVRVWNKGAAVGRQGTLSARITDTLDEFQELVTRQGGHIVPKLDVRGVVQELRRLNLVGSVKRGPLK